jgi:type IV pilus biogenesis protein CpaD/CtpE
MNRMKKPMLAALALSSVVLLAGCNNNAPVEEEVLVDENTPEIEIVADEEEPEIEVISTEENVLSGAEEVEAAEAPETEEATGEVVEEAAE